MRPIHIAAQLHPQHGSWRDLRRAAIRSRRARRRHPLPWTIQTALRRARRQALRVLVDAGRLGRGRPRASSSARSWPATRTATPTSHADIARTHRPRQRRARDHGPRGRLVPARLPAIRVRLRDDARTAHPSPGASHPGDHRAPCDPRTRRRNGACRSSSPASARRSTLPIVANHADARHAVLPGSAARSSTRGRAALIGHCTAIGRDPYEIEWKRRPGARGPPSVPARGRIAYLELGFTQFTFGFNGPDWTVEQGADFLAWRDQVNAAKVA